MTPEQSIASAKKKLEEEERRLANMERAKRLTLKVGLPAGEQASSKAYKSDGQKSAPTVLEVGIWHEYGTETVPMRSFLRGPFEFNKTALSNFIAAQFSRVEKGVDADKALGLVGVFAVNISRGAFKTKGYGVWADIKQSTKNAKGSSQVLIDTGILRNAITWVVE